MDKVESYINDIKKSTKTDTDIRTTLDKLNSLIKDALERKIAELNIQNEYKPWVDSIIRNWSYPIKWEIKSIPHAYTIRNEKNEYSIGLRVDQQLLIFNKTEEIRLAISNIVEEIKNICDSRYMLCNERVLLNKLHELYKNLSEEDGIDLKKIISRCFNVKYVKYEADYKNADYFESYKSDVIEAETRFDAMVSRIDDYCIEKGVYLYPQNKE